MQASHAFADCPREPCLYLRECASKHIIAVLITTGSMPSVVAILAKLLTYKSMLTQPFILTAGSLTSNPQDCKGQEG